MHFLLHNIKSHRISGRVFSAIFSFLSSKRLLLVLDDEPFQEHSVNSGLLQGFLPRPLVSQIYINDIPDDAICNIVIYADDTALFYNCD